MMKTLIHPLNQPTPLPRSIALLFRRKLWTSTYLGLESYLPASKGCWRRELVKEKIRNLQSLLVCSIILWIVSSTDDDWIFGWRSRLASHILISFWSITLLHCRHVNRFLNNFLPKRVQFLRIRAEEKACGFAKTFPDIPDVSQIFGGPSVRRGDTNEGLNNPSKGGCSGNNIGWLVTCEFPLRTDSASWKSLESFMQITSFCSSCNLPDNSIIVFWSSMNFCLVSVSKVELWNFSNSFISVRFCWWTSRTSCCWRHNSSCRILTLFCSSCLEFVMRNFLATLCDDRSSLLIEPSPNLRTRAFTLLSNSNDLFHRFPRSIDQSFSLSDYRKLILSTIHVSDTKTKMIDIAPFHKFPRAIDHDRDWRRTDTYTFRTVVIGVLSVYFCQ